MRNSDIATLLVVHFSFITSMALLLVVSRNSQKSLLRDASFIFALVVFIWNLGTMLEMDYRLVTGETVTSVVSIMLIDLCYLAICFSPIAVLFLGRVVYKPDWRPTIKHGSFLIIPTVSFMMVCTNPLHNLFFRHFSLYSSEAIYGPYYYFHSAYSYACILLGLGYIVLFTLRSSGILSKQFFLVLVSILVPLTGNVLFSFGVADLPFSINACLFTVSIICISVAIFKYRFINIAPIDMRQVVDLISDGFLQTDKDMYIVDYNKTIVDLFPNVASFTQTTTLADLFQQIGLDCQNNDYLNLLDLYEKTIVDKTSANMEVIFPESQCFLIKITPVFNKDKHTGSIIIFKNTADLNSTDETKLQRTLSEVEESNKSLSEKVREGMLRLEEERQARQSLYDSNPNINFIADLDYNIIDCNPSALKFYDFENKEEFKHGLVKKINQSILAKMPGGAGGVPISQRLADVVAQGETSFDTTLLFDEEEIPFHFDLKMVPYKGSKVIAVYQTDLREIRKIEEDLERRDMLLAAINMVASRLISVEDEDFARSFGESIAMLGRSINVERVVVWKNFEKDGELYCTQIHEWCEGSESQHGKPHTINIRYSDTVPTWESTLRLGKCVNSIVKDLLPVEREQMRRQGIVSVLAVPLFVRDIFWGFVGFDDCINERVFSEMEESTLGSGAMLIAAALFRNEITNSLIISREAALSSTRAKSSFLANMSHEIRTPLNAIVGMANIAKRKTAGGEAAGSIEEILVASKHLMELINDILDFSKIESGKMELVDEAFDLCSAVHEVTSLINPRCAEKNIEFETNLESLAKVAVSGDRLRIKQVLINLLGNAVKFTDRNGTIKFTTEVIAQSESEITMKFLVCDNGIGISEEQIPNLFNAFEQGDSSVSVKYKGTGLGLAISQNIVKAMGGEIILESSPNEGSTFHFTVNLPRADLEKILENRGAKVENLNLSGKHILMVEDIEINRVILKELLFDTGVEISEAVDGKQALQIFEQSELNSYDLIFMDIQMPNMDGYQTTGEIRKLNRSDAKNVPIIAMTANAYREDIEHTFDAGMNGHLAKPIDIDAVMQLLYDKLGE